MSPGPLALHTDYSPTVGRLTGNSEVISRPLGWYR